MIELHPGMKVHAKTVDIIIDGVTLSYRPPRGTRFALLLLGNENPNAPEDKLINVNAWLKEVGWKEPEEKN